MIKQKAMCLLLPTVPFNSYRGKGGNMLKSLQIPRGRSLWGKNQLPFSVLCWRGVKGAGLCWAPAPAHATELGLGGLWAPLALVTHGLESQPCPPGHCCHQLPLLLASHSVWPLGWLLLSRMHCRCLNIVTDSSVVFVRNGWLKNGITEQKS